MSTPPRIKLHSLPKVIYSEEGEDRDTDETHSATTNGEQEDRDRMIAQENKQSKEKAETEKNSSAPAPTPASLPREEATLVQNLTDLNLVDNHGVVAAETSAELHPPAEDATAAVVIEETGELPSLYVGRIIGKGGETIRDLQARSGCHIDVDQNAAPGAPRTVLYRGSRREDIDLAKRLVAMLCERGAGDVAAELPLGRATMKRVLVPDDAIGRIIGRRGETIRELQSKSQARIQVDHSGDYHHHHRPGGDAAEKDAVDCSRGGRDHHRAAGMDAVDRRQVTIVGTKDSVAKAEGMILLLSTYHNSHHDKRVAHENDLMYQQFQWTHPGAEVTVASGRTDGEAYWAGGNIGDEANVNTGNACSDLSTTTYANLATPIVETNVIPCTRANIGHIIGRKGATIQDLQRRSDCNIQINQRDCQIAVTGPRHGIEMAKLMLRQIVERGPDHPYAGGRRFKQREGSPLQQGLVQEERPLEEGYLDPGYGMLPQLQPYCGEQPAIPHPYQQQPYAIPQGQYPSQTTSPWRAVAATDGRVYYYNQDTLETRWEPVDA